MDLNHNIIEYVNCCVGAFANRFKLTTAQAYAYMRRFKGIDFLIDCYAAEHTISIDDAVEDVAFLCKKNGGHLENTTMSADVQFQVECLSTELAEMLMGKYGWDIKKALDELYSSETYKRLCNPECGLYYESAIYVFSYLQNEIETGMVS